MRSIMAGAGDFRVSGKGRDRRESRRILGGAAASGKDTIDHAGGRRRYGKARSSAFAA
jgi:hypothetical protein